MEPITLLGLVVVIYGGYVSLHDLWRELALGEFFRKVPPVQNRSQRLTVRVLDQVRVKKMAGMNI